MEEDTNKNHRKTLENVNQAFSDVKNRLKAISDGFDEEAWASLNFGIEKVQMLLDQNRVLIQQVNDNHVSKIPDNLVKNVALIREINANISKILAIYGDISVNFTNIVRQRKVGSNVAGSSKQQSQQ